MTVIQLDISDFLQQSQGQLVIDVRAPIEYHKGHMTGAINVPLFEDAERAEIGTLYKEQGHDTAVARGLEIVSPKMVAFVKQVKELSKNGNAYVYCLRGGMRSNSFCWLLNTAGLNARMLKGGYKSYRKEVLLQLAAHKRIVLLGGKTGSGKTDVLKALARLSYQVIDIERAANHKGSAFGAINEPKQQPQQIFENILFDQCYALDPGKPVIIENESQNLGYNRIPHELWIQMKTAHVIRLEVPHEQRLKKLVEDYATADIGLLKGAVNKIASQLGPQNTTLCIQLLEEGRLEEVADITLKYYDKAYDFSSRKNNHPVTVIESDTIDAEVNAQKVIAALKQIEHDIR